MLADFIPPDYFIQAADDFGLWVLWALSAVAIAVLVYGADRAVTGAARFARVLGIPMVIVGATVVSLGTTSPEAFVSVTAAFQGKPGLALGNGVGSIICDTALIFGLCCVIAPLPKNRFILNRHGWIQLAAGTLLTGTILVLAAMAGGFERVVLGRSVGIVFVLLLVGYLYVSVRWAKQHPEIVADTPSPEQDAAAHRARSSVKNLALVFAGLGLVLVGSNVLIGSVSELCRRYEVPPDVIAVTLVAFGTSLPELATAIAAIVKGHPELLVGNIVGADILNVLFVIGASAVASPLAVPQLFVTLHLPVMMLALVLLRLYIFSSGSTFRRWQGVPLLGLFAAYYVLLLTGFGRPS